MLTMVNRIVALTVVFVTPASFPNGGIVGGKHAALAGCRHMLVLTEGKRGDMADRTYWPSFIVRAVGLCATLDDVLVVSGSQFENRVHIAGPSCQMNRDDGFRHWAKHRTNSLGAAILAVAINIHRDHPRADRCRATGRSDKRATGADNLISWSDSDRPEGCFQRDCSIG